MSLWPRPAFLAVLAAVALPTSLAAQSVEVPALVLGTWSIHQADCNVSSATYAFASDAVVTAERRCPYTGSRQLHPARWYLDAKCPDGTLVQLDINRLSADRIMIATRPLGEANTYLRCQN